MTSLNISLESLESEQVYYGAHMHYAMEDINKMTSKLSNSISSTGKKLRASLESQQENEDKGIIAKIAEKVRQFFAWMKELMSKFWAWIKGNQNKQEEVASKVQEAIKDGFGTEGKLLSSVKTKEEVLASFMKELSSQDSETDWSKNANVIKISSFIGKYVEARNAALTGISKKTPNTLSARSYLLKGENGFHEVIESFSKEIFEKLLNGTDPVDLLAVDPSGVNLERVSEYVGIYTSLAGKYKRERLEEVLDEIIKAHEEIVGSGKFDEENFKDIIGMMGNESVGAAFKEIIKKGEAIDKAIGIVEEAIEKKFGDLLDAESAKIVLRSAQHFISAASVARKCFSYMMAFPDDVGTAINRAVEAFHDAQELLRDFQLSETSTNKIIIETVKKYFPKIKE